MVERPVVGRVAGYVTLSPTADYSLASGHWETSNARYDLQTEALMTLGEAREEAERCTSEHAPAHWRGEPMVVAKVVPIAIYEPATERKS